MAIFHFSGQILKRNVGHNAVAAAAYRSQGKLHEISKMDALEATAYRSGGKIHGINGKVHDYTKKRGVVHTEIMLPEDAPREYSDRETLWNAVEKAEKRKDAQLAREFNIALPVEFDRQEQIDVMRKYIKENFVDMGMCADFALHDKGDGNPHTHIMFSMREVTEKGFGKKNRDWNNRELMQTWRENWAESCNVKFHEKGLTERIDHRTLKAQGIDREAQIHIGSRAWAMQKRGIETAKVRQNREIVPRNKQKEHEKEMQKKSDIKYRIENKKDSVRDTLDIIRKSKETVKPTNEQKRYDVMRDKIQQFGKIERLITGLLNMANDMQRRFVKIEEKAEHLDEARERRKGLRFWQIKTKKQVDNEISDYTQFVSSLRAGLRKTYGIELEYVPAEIKRIKDEVARLQSQLPAPDNLTELQKTFEREQLLRLTDRIRSDHIERERQRNRHRDWDRGR